MGASYEIIAKYKDGKKEAKTCVVNLHKDNGHVFMCFIRDKYFNELKDKDIRKPFEIQINTQSLMWLEEILISLKNSESFEDLKKSIADELPYVCARKGKLPVLIVEWVEDEFTKYDVKWILSGGIMNLHNYVQDALDYAEKNPDSKLYFSYIP